MVVTMSGWTTTSLPRSSAIALRRIADQQDHGPQKPDRDDQQPEETRQPLNCVTCGRERELTTLLQGSGQCEEHRRLREPETLPWRTFDRQMEAVVNDPDRTTASPPSQRPKAEHQRLKYRWVQPSCRL